MNERKYRQYAESSTEQIDADRETLLNALLQEARGYGNRLSAKQLAERTGINDSTIRDAIIELRSEFSVPIGNVGSGYFVIETPQERERVLSYYDDEIETKQERRQEIADLGTHTPRAAPKADGGAETVEPRAIRRAIRETIKPKDGMLRDDLLEAIDAPDDTIEDELETLETAGFIYCVNGEVRLP